MLSIEDQKSRKLAFLSNLLLRSAFPFRLPPRPPSLTPAFSYCIAFCASLLLPMIPAGPLHCPHGTKQHNLDPRELQSIFSRLLVTLHPHFPRYSI